MKIQQPVTTSTYTKYGQRYWRQPENTKPKTQKNLDKRGSDSFHNQQGRYVCYETCCYAGNSAQLLVLEKMKTCDHASKIHQINPGKTCVKSSEKLDLKNTSALHGCTSIWSRSRWFHSNAELYSRTTTAAAEWLCQVVCFRRTGIL